MERYSLTKIGYEATNYHLVYDDGKIYGGKIIAALSTTNGHDWVARKREFVNGHWTQTELLGHVNHRHIWDDDGARKIAENLRIGHYAVDDAEKPPLAT